MELDKPYNRGEFIAFLNTFLPEDYEPNPSGEDVAVSKGLIQKAVFLGAVPSLDNLRVYEIHHQSESDPRVTITKEICRLMANHGVRKAIAVFISKKSDNYRLSLITIDVNLVGKRTVREYSNPRRYSFYLGPDAKIHTPSDYLVKKGAIRNNDDLVNRFNVELVTKEFFQKYKELYEKISKHLQSDRGFGIFAGINNVDLDTFAKKLLGQIVFLYFIQRKGWLGAAKGAPISSGNKDFVRSLFNKAKAEGKPFFNDYLEYLFYDALNKKPEKPGSFYRDYFECQIPFLNGGLFEPIVNYNWRNEVLNIPDSLFSNNQGNGVLDVFDLFNFTVYEDDQIDKEVSIDPEMLGKVFENLLPENLRKGKGAYYTPREIVHYMCQESLINYLAEKSAIKAEEIRDYIKKSKISTDGTTEIPGYIAKKAKMLDDCLAEIKVVDPAVGSGAFLVGMLHEIVNFRIGLNFVIKKKRLEYELKKQAIINSLYGVDIDPGAVEIAKLRLWLSLVVDYALDDIDPLPNLDFKIMQGNSLVELLLPSLLAKTTDSNRNRLIDELNKIKANYSLLTDHQEKKKTREQINRLVRAIANYDIEKEKKRIWGQIMSKKAQTKLFIDPTETIPLAEAEDKETKILSKQLQELDKVQRVSPTEHFEWHINFNEVFEKGGFDVVIANPPYNELRDLGQHEQNTYRKSAYLQYALGGRINVFQFFYPLAVTIAKTNGIVTLITQNSLLAEDSALNNRRFIIENTQIIKLVSFPERDDPSKRVFESAKMSVCIGILRANANIPNDYCFDINVWYDRYFQNGHVLNIHLSDVVGVYPDNLIFPLSTQSAFRILRKLKKHSNVFCVNASSGEIDMTKYRNKFNLAQSGYRVFTGAQVLRYRTTKDPTQGEVIYLNIPLSEFSSERNGHIKNERIVMQRITGVDSNARLIMTIIPGGNLCANSTNYIPKNDAYDLRLLLGILNSRLINFYFKQTSTNTNITTSEINNIPIINVTGAQGLRIISMVDNIIAIANSADYLSNDGKQAKVSKYEEQIDQMVYKLYGLTPEEIKMVEGTK